MLWSAPMRRLVVCLTALGVASLLSAARAEPTRAAPSKAPPAYRACPGDLVWNESAGACVCAGALHWDAQTKKCSAACPVGKMQKPDAPPGVCTWLPHTCPAGQHWSELHDACVAVCPTGKVANKAGTACIADSHGCPEGTQWFESRSACLPFCAPGASLDYDQKKCVTDAGITRTASARTEAAPVETSETAPPPRPPPPPAAPTKREASRARAPTPTACPEGKEWKAAWSGCVPKCADDEILDFHGIACHPLRRRR